MASIVASHGPGDRVEVVFERRGRTHRGTMTLAEDPTLEVVTYEAAGREVTDAMKAFREAWLGMREPAATATS